jgi:WD40 repeat protein
LYQGKAGELDVSTLLAIDSYQRSPSFQAEEILRQNITYLPSPIAQMSQAGTISEIHLHPDGKIFVSASADGTACVWNVIDGRKLYCVHQEKSLNDAVFSPDGNWLATAGDDGKVFLWAAGDGSEKTRYDLGEPVSVVAFSPDSAWLVIGHKQGLRAINLVNAKQKDLNVKMPSAVTAMAFSPDGLWGAVGTVSGATFIWKPGSLYTSPGPLHTEQVLSLAFSPNSRTFVSSGADSTVRLANTVSGREVNVWRTGDWAEEVAFSPDGTSVASASDDNRLWIWDVKTGREKFRLRHDGFVQRVTYSPDGQWVASTGFDQTLRLWGAQSGSQMIQVSLPGIGSAVAFSADGGTVIVGDRDGNLSLWKISALLARIGYLEFPEYIREVKLSADGQTMFANSDDRKVRSLPTANLLTTHAVETADTLFTADGLTYNLALSLDENWLAAAESYNNGIVLYDRKNKVSRTLSQEDKIITGLAFTPDSRMLASSGIGNKVYLWDVQTAKKTAELPNASAVQGLAISPDGTRLVAGLDGRASTTVWDLGTRTKIAELSQVGDVVAVVFSPDGKWVATGDTLGVVNLWDGRDFANPKPLAMLQINGKVLNLLFSPDQHWLVMGSSDTYLHIFDTSTWKEVSRIPHASDVTGVTFSQDGKWLYTVSRKVIQIWDTSKLVLVPNEKLIETACAHLISNLSLTQWQTLFYAEPYRLICPGLPQGKH